MLERKHRRIHQRHRGLALWACSLGSVGLKNIEVPPPRPALLRLGLRDATWIRSSADWFLPVVAFTVWDQAGDLSRRASQGTGSRTCPDLVVVPLRCFLVASS